MVWFGQTRCNLQFNGFFESYKIGKSRMICDQIDFSHPFMLCMAYKTKLGSWRPCYSEDSSKSRLDCERVKEGRRGDKMAVGGFAVDDNSRAFSGKVTASVVITCIVAASGGLIFGYDIGISGEYRFFSFLSIFGKCFVSSFCVHRKPPSLVWTRSTLCIYFMLQLLK